MDFQASILERARKSPRTLVLPESWDKRILHAASIASREGIANIILLGEREEVESLARQEKINLKKVEIRSLEDRKEGTRFADKLTELRAHRGMTREKAQALMANPVWYSAMMVKQGQAECMIAGAATSSADVFHPALQIVGMARDCEVVSTAVFLEVPHCSYGHKGLFLYADCVTVENPTESQLAAIAVSSGHTWETLTRVPAKIALLSYSTRGSALSPYTDKVRRAAEEVRRKAPELISDGELQFDAAIIPEIAAMKAPDSPLKGEANVLVFPDLNSANSNYKNTERLAGGRFLGSVIQGLAQPVNDLSRGASVQSIVDTIATTVLQAGVLDKETDYDE